MLVLGETISDIPNKKGGKLGEPEVLILVAEPVLHLLGRVTPELASRSFSLASLLPSGLSLNDCHHQQHPLHLFLII